MSTLSIHKLPDPLEKAIQATAKTRNITKTEIVVRALESYFVLGKDEERYTQLRSFFKSAPKINLKAFNKKIQELEKIDSELWS